ncbi:zinc-binding dehydrogenase [Rhodococcus opacus]|uniref:zinc-binding dehydrogenase n=1 Tax=Rhodococcus opacus TaxID=37919 RepID=UPI0029558D97|nr:zinc-binding dehydrogenase [Rhodococcus opacus]MDV7085653.1 zinc-binding dehydrogenase [Rhodococcus opacus]
MTNSADIDIAPTRSVAGPPRLVRAAVSMPDTTTTVRHLDTDAAIGAVGWLEVESSAVCGTDVGLYRAGLDSPTVLGHHVVGTVVSVEETQSTAWDVRPGDRVALEEYLPCLREACPACRIGDYRMCPHTDLFAGKRRVGLVSADDGAGLHGGNAEYMQLSANSLVYRLPADLDADLAAWTQPFANALDWTVDAGGAREGSTVVVIGPGYHGIAAVAAARAVGAARIVVIGVPDSDGRLEIAESLGAVPVINNNHSLPELILRATGGEGTDVLLDTVGLGGEAVAAAARVLRKRGRLVIGGLGSTPVCELDLKSLVRGANTIVGVRGRSPDAVTRSIELLADGRSGLEIVPSVDVDLDQVDNMLGRMATGQGPVSPHVVIRPQLRRPADQKRGTLS